jgi:hypothetical protein
MFNCKMKSITMIYLFLIISCSSVELKTSNSKMEKTGTIILEFENSEKDYLNSVQFRLSKEKPTIRTEWTLLFLDIFFIVPYQIDAGHVIQTEVNYHSDGYLESNKEYIFTVAEGKYFGSLSNNFNDSASKDKKYSKRLNNSQKGFLFNFTSENVDSCSKVVFSDIAIQAPADKYECGALIIQKADVIKIKIIGNQKQIDYPATVFCWFPGIIVLMPLWYGTEIYSQTFSINYSKLRLLNSK